MFQQRKRAFQFRAAVYKYSIIRTEKMVTQDPAFWGIRKLSSFKNVFNHSSAIKSLIPPGNKKQKEMGQVN